MITIIDSGGANIASVQFALQRLGVSARLSHDSELIKKSSHLILPGVGSAGAAMTRLREFGLVEVIPRLTQPLLGICLGMQLLFDFLEEDHCQGLGLISGKIKKITANQHCTVPHMGWNRLNFIKKSALMKNISDQAYAYFIHSYAAPLGHYTAASTAYDQSFSAVVQDRNFFGTQFHPERSAAVGSQLLKNFLEL